jgi:alpha-beta hydrolase superfamily lysophospholipase
MRTEVQHASTAVDVLGEPYTATTFTLAPDSEGEVVATLVRKAAPVRTDHAVLYVHGFCDYYFQTELAEFWNAQGYDFYALDLRKYGRSMRPHQTPCYVEDLTAYYEELDFAWAVITDDHPDVVVNGHSTGGLVVSMWLNDRKHTPSAVVLNSPWLDMQGDLFTRTALMAAVDGIGRRNPGWVIPRNVSGYYGESLHREYGGEWDFNLAWKPLDSFPVRAGWVRAIRAGHARVASGLDVQAPILVLCSTKSATPKRGSDPSIHSTDIVLDVEQIRRRAPLLGEHVTVAMFEGALHDVVLSAEPVRKRAYEEIDRFLSYVAN